MINSTIRLAITLLLLLLAQALLFNNIQLSGYINPYVYILFILLLPLEIPAAIVMILAFGAGLTFDLYSGSVGMHAFACTIAAFIRPYVLKALAPREGYTLNAQPTMYNYGVRWFFIYAAIITAVHHTALFFIEVFNILEILRILLRTLLSTAFSLTFIMLIEYYRKGR